MQSLNFTYVNPVLRFMLRLILDECYSDIRTLVRSFSKVACLNLLHSTLMSVGFTRKSEHLDNPSTLILVQTLGIGLHIHSNGIMKILPPRKNRCPIVE